MNIRRGPILLTLAVTWFAAAPGAAGTLVVPPRPGQVGLSLQGGYGTLLSSGELGSNYDVGGSFAVRLKYRMRYERGIGLSFESQSFDTRADAKFTDPQTGLPITLQDLIAPTRLTVVLSGLDLYQMWGTRTSTTRMVSAGFGIAQVHAKLNDGETEFHQDGAYLSAGVGLERFFYRSFAWDLSARYYAIFENGSTNHSLQAAIGVAFYAGY